MPTTVSETARYLLPLGRMTIGRLTVQFMVASYGSRGVRDNQATPHAHILSSIAF
jgi:hypothetical protein